MHKKSQLFQLLGLLSPNEFSDLGDFLASPYCNSVKRLSEFHKALKDFHPNFDAMRLTPEELFNKVYPEGKAYNDGELRSLMSKFYKAANEFLAFNELKQNEVLKAKLTTISLSQKDNYALFAEKAEAFIQQLLEKKERDLAHYLAMFEMNRHWFFHPLTKKRQEGAEIFQQTVSNLDRFFTLAKLRLAAEQLLTKRQATQQVEISYLEEAIKQAAAFAGDNPVFGIYLKIIRLFLGENDDEVFQQLKNEFRRHGNLLREEERNEVYPFLTSHAIRQGNLGNEKYHREQFEIYNDWLESGLLVENNKFPESVFRQIVAVACFQREFEWVEKFMADYQKFLPPQERETELSIGKAEMLFYQHEYREAIDFLNRYQPQDLIVELWARRRTIQCLYEDYVTNATVLETLEARIAAFDKFLQREKTLSKDLVNGHQKFCRLTKRVANGKNLERKPKEELSNKLKEELAQEMVIACREWLLEKIEAL